MKGKKTVDNDLQMYLLILDGTTNDQNTLLILDGITNDQSTMNIIIIRFL